MPSTAPALALAGYAKVKFPYTTIIAHRYALARRTALYNADSSPPTAGDLLDEIASTTQRINQTATKRSWRQTDPTNNPNHVAQTNPPNRRRYRLIALAWLLLLTPSILYYAPSGPRTTGLKQAFTNIPLYTLSLTALTISTIWIVWNLITGLRALPTARTQPHQHHTTRIIHQTWTALGTLAFTTLVTTAALQGAEPERQFWANTYHAIDALTAILLIAAIALIIAAIIFYPPSGIIWLTLAGGGAIPIGIGVSTGYHTRRNRNQPRHRRLPPPNSKRP